MAKESCWKATQIAIALRVIPAIVSRSNILRHRKRFPQTNKATEIAIAKL